MVNLKTYKFILVFSYVTNCDSVENEYSCIPILIG